MAPDSAESWYLKGLADVQAGRLDEAHASVERAVALGGERLEFLMLRTLVLRERGDLEGAERALERIIDLNPELARAHVELGILRAARGGELDGALAALDRALALEPDNALARSHLARVRAMRAQPLADGGRFEDARREYRAGARADPGNLRAALGANLLLPPVYESREHLERSRAQYAEGLGRLHSSASSFRFESAEHALAQASWTNFYLAYQGGDDVELQSRYSDLVEAIVSGRAPELFRPIARRAAGARIRVGFMSHFLVDGTVGRYFAPWITRLDRRRFEIFVYHTNELATDLSRTIAASADAFRHLPRRPVGVRARQVLDDELDVLVYPESGMHDVTFLMGALRLAPVQCCGWGHPDTTGHRNMDWFISCEAMEPDRARSRYRERLALLPGLGTRYEIAHAHGGADRSALGLPEGRTLYLVPQSLFKIHPGNDDLLAQVLERDPEGVAVFFASPHESVTRAFVARLRRSMSLRDVSFEEQVRVLPRLAHGDYLRVNQLCDVMLDTLHWSGGNTSLDAIACGLPVVTCPGELMRGRQTKAMLDLLGLPGLAARDAAGYVDIATRLGKDPDERRAIAGRMRDNRGAIFERDEPVRAFEEFLERAVREA